MSNINLYRNGDNDDGAYLNDKYNSSDLSPKRYIFHCMDEANEESDDDDVKKINSEKKFNSKEIIDMSRKIDSFSNRCGPVDVNILKSLFSDNVLHSKNEYDNLPWSSQQSESHYINEENKNFDNNDNEEFKIGNQSDNTIVNCVNKKCKNYLKLIWGPMFAGKTTELIRIVNEHRHNNKKVMVIKSLMDKRYTDKKEIITHENVRMKANHNVKDLKTVLKDVDNYDIIAIDEGQFYDNLIEFCKYVYFKKKKSIIVSALQSTFDLKPFANISNLSAIATHIRTLNAKCGRCDSDANFSYRMANSEEQNLSGGPETYVPLCGSCFYERGSYYVEKDLENMYK
jgi:thymidine kinase